MSHSLDHNDLSPITCAYITSRETKLEAIKKFKVQITKSNNNPLLTSLPQIYNLPQIAKMTSSDSQLFLDAFTITSFDQSKYDRVARIKGTSTDQTTQFSLDINTDLYRLSSGETIELSLVSTLNLDGSKDDEKGTWRDNSGEGSLADMWDYVCYGKVYRFEEGTADKGGQEIM